MGRVSEIYREILLKIVILATRKETHYLTLQLVMNKNNKQGTNLKVIYFYNLLYIIMWWKQWEDYLIRILQLSSGLRISNLRWWCICKILHVIDLHIKNVIFKAPYMIKAIINSAYLIHLLDLSSKRRWKWCVDCIY